MAVGAAAVVLAGVALVRVPASLSTDPREPVAELVEALEARDTERVLELVDMEPEDEETGVFGGVLRGQSSDGSTAPGLLTPGALDGGYQPPRADLGESWEVGEVPGAPEWERQPPTAHRTPVSFAVGDAEWSVSLRTIRENGGWVRDWTLDDEAGRTTVLGGISLPYDPVGPLTVAGMAFEPVEPDALAFGTGRRVDALVGEYTVRYEHPLFESRAEAVVVRSGADTELMLPVGAVRADVAEEVDAQIRSHVEDCAEEMTGLRSVGCVLGHDPGHYLPLRGDAVWRIERLPEVRLDVTEDEDGSGHPGVVVATEAPGEASVTYAILQEEERTVTVDIEVGGDVLLDDAGAPVWWP
jgi:hypothetical protein